MKRVFQPDHEITKQLNEYRVEYQVLQEEMVSVKSQIENMEKLEHVNKQLTREITHLNEQFEVGYMKLYLSLEIKVTTIASGFEIKFWATF